MTKTYRIAALATVALLAAACADAPSAPTAAPSLEIVSPAVVASTLTRTASLREALSAEAVIDSLGGDIKLPGAGFKFKVPAGALREPTRITVTAVAGDDVAYVFEPHGLHFAIPATFEQELKGTSLYKATNFAKVEGGYFAHPSQLDGAADQAVVNEFLPVSVDVKGSKIVFGVEHFSGYLVATGRKR